MFKKAIKAILAAIFVNILSNSPALADSNFTNTVNNTYEAIGSAAIGITNTAFSIKKGQPYDETNDPAFKSFQGGPTDTSPQHGYFAVPLVVIGLAAILIFLTKND